MTIKDFIATFEMKLHHYATVAGATILVIFSLLGLKSCQTKRDETIASTSLKAGVQEKIIVNPSKHTITVISDKGTQLITLPDHPSIIEILKTGKVKITAPQWGYELDPFLGAAFSLHGGLLGAGADLFYYKKLDLGMGFMPNPSYMQDTGLFVAVSYRVWSNTSLALGIDNHTTPLLLIKVRL